MLSKNKILYQSSANEVIKRHQPPSHQPSPLQHCKDKKKVNCKVKNTPVVQPIINQVKSKHASSRSNLEMQRMEFHYQQKWANQEPQNKRNSTLRFTDLLENSKKGYDNNTQPHFHSGISLKNHQNCQLSCFENYKKTSQNNESDEFNMTKKMHRINNRIYDQNSINNLKQTQHSIEFVKKSPLRVLNTNRLNNTPKIFQQKNDQGHYRDSSINTKSIAKTKNSINLECSEKITKFLQDSGKVNLPKGKPQQNNRHPSKNKSNLLSTGIINLSHPKDLQNWYQKDSKSNIFPRQFDIKTFRNKQLNEQQELSSEKADLDNKQKLQQLLNRSNQLNNCIDKIQNNRQTSITTLIHQNNNPQLIPKSYIKLQISQLNHCKSQTMTLIHQFISKVNNLSHLYEQNIDSMIKSLEESERSGIRWYCIDQSLSFDDQMQNLRLRNSILIERLNVFQQRGLQQYDWNIQQSISENINSQQMKQEIHSIDHQMAENQKMFKDLINHQHSNAFQMMDFKSVGKQELKLLSIEMKKFNLLLGGLCASSKPLF